MSIKKRIKFTTGSITLPPTSSSHITYPPTSVLPLGEQPEGNLNLEGALDKLGDTIKGLIQNINTLQENLNKLTKENQRLKKALGIVTIEEDSHGH
jgi:hypothetical protein|tara:strand:- start:459 stop:746 length:288 start_codon:yes stop_codon:yes gene_type:complete